MKIKNNKYKFKKFNQNLHRLQNIRTFHNEKTTQQKTNEMNRVFFRIQFQNYVQIRKTRIKNRRINTPLTKFIKKDARF